MNTPNLPDVGPVIATLRTLCLPVAAAESVIHLAVADCLRAAGLEFQQEVWIALRCRIDFLLPGGIGIEVKKGKANSAAVARQLDRYAASPRINTLILLVERSVHRAPLSAGGKPVHYVALNKLRGIAT